jgi:hypothetical protein
MLHRRLALLVDRRQRLTLSASNRGPGKRQKSPTKPIANRAAMGGQRSAPIGGQPPSRFTAWIFLGHCRCDSGQTHHADIRNPSRHQLLPTIAWSSCWADRQERTEVARSSRQGLDRHGIHRLARITAVAGCCRTLSVPWRVPARFACGLVGRKPTRPRRAREGPHT